MKQYKTNSAVQLKLNTGVIAKTNHVDLIRSGFYPLPAGVYELGEQIDAVVEVLLPQKPTVYLPLLKLREYVASGQAELCE